MTSTTSGSIYTVSSMPGSVIIVAGLELTRMVSTPSSRRGFAGLCTGVVELGGLADDYRPRSNDQDFPGYARHALPLSG